MCANRLFNHRIHPLLASKRSEPTEEPLIEPFCIRIRVCVRMCRCLYMCICHHNNAVLCSSRIHSHRNVFALHTLVLMVIHSQVCDAITHHHIQVWYAVCVFASCVCVCVCRLDIIQAHQMLPIPCLVCYSLTLTLKILSPFISVESASVRTSEFIYTVRACWSVCLLEIQFKTLSIVLRLRIRIRNAQNEACMIFSSDRSSTELKSFFDSVFS